MGAYSQFGVTVRDTGSSLEAVVLSQSLFLILPGHRVPHTGKQADWLPIQSTQLCPDTTYVSNISYSPQSRAHQKKGEASAPASGGQGDPKQRSGDTQHQAEHQTLEGLVD